MRNHSLLALSISLLALPVVTQNVTIFDYADTGVIFGTVDSSRNLQLTAVADFTYTAVVGMLET